MWWKSIATSFKAEQSIRELHKCWSYIPWSFSGEAGCFRTESAFNLWSAVFSLHFTLDLHFTPGLQSVCSLRFTLTDMKIIYVNWGRRNEFGSAPRSYERYLSSSENKTWNNSFEVVNLNQHNDQLPAVPLLTQLGERCPGITCRGNGLISNHVRAWIFLRPYFHYYLNSFHNCKDRFHIRHG